MAGHSEPPPDLPQLAFPDLQQWVREHPEKSFYPDADKAPDDDEIMLKTGITIAIHAVGEVVEVLEPIGWIHLGWDILESMAERAEREELPEKRREAQREAWNAFMWEKFWTGQTEHQSREAREAAFDTLVADGAGHGVVPELTKEAEAKRAELIHQIDDRWLERTQTINDLQQQLADVETKKPDLATSEEHKRNLADAAEYRKRAEEFRTAANMPNPTMHVPPNWQGDGYEVGVDRKWALEQAEYLEQQASVAENKVQGEWEIWRDHVRHDLEAQHAGQLDDLRNDVKAVTDFDTNQANWNLTSDQAAMLTCEKPPEEPGGTSTFDNADGIYDVVGGRPD